MPAPARYLQTQIYRGPAGVSSRAERGIHGCRIRSLATPGMTRAGALASPGLAAGHLALRLRVAFDFAFHRLLGFSPCRFVLGGGVVVARHPQRVRLALEVRMDVARHQLVAAPGR